jgi:hypothetical protein
VSLAEMLVGMVVSSIVMGAAAVMFTVAIESNTTTEVRLDTINSARVSVEAMSRSLRTAVLRSQLSDTSAPTGEAAFLSAAPAGVEFYANVNNVDGTVGPSRVSYAVTGGSLVQTTQPPEPLPAGSYEYQYCDLSVASCFRRTQLLADGVDTSAGVFTYYATDGSVILPTGTCGGGPCLGPTDLARVDAVEIRVQVRSTKHPKLGPSTYVTRVALPNNDAVIRNGGST